MIPERLRNLRNEKKMTQQDVADVIEIDRTTYTKYESGKSKPDSVMLDKLAIYFDVSVDYLLGRTNVRNSNNSADEFPPEAQVLMRSVAKLTNKQWEIIKKLVQEFVDED
jgi:transcriptional regulator with XRE-family HTH domain